jgi:multiple sugar transport system substrate-binding protein
MRSESQSFSNMKTDLSDKKVPYDTIEMQSIGTANQTLIDRLDFLEELQNEIESCFGVSAGFSELRILSALMKNHLKGKISTKTSLVGFSGMAFGTAMRTIRRIEEQGLIIRRPKTETGKSFSLHPSEKLISQWHELSRRMEYIFKTNSGQYEELNNRANYYFGSSYQDVNVLPPSSIMANNLPLKKGLSLLVHADPTFLAMAKLKKNFEIMFGVNIQNRALSIDRLREEILINATREQSKYDIIACDLPWFGEMADAGHFIPLDGFMNETAFDSDDFNKEAMASARFKGQQYGIPIQTTPELLVCRKDVFQEMGLKYPETTQELLDAAYAIQRSSISMKAIAWNAARGTPLGHSFLFSMGSFGQPIIDLRKCDNGFDAEWPKGEELRPMFLTNEAREVCNFFAELISVSPKNILNMSWFERARAYANGEVGMAFTATLLSPMFEFDRMSPAFGKSQYLPLPAGGAGRQIAPVGGYALAIPKNVASQRVSHIWSAIQEFSSAKATKIFIENGSLVSPRNSVSKDKEVQKISFVIGVIDELARADILKMWPRPPIPEISHLISIAGTEIHDFLSGSINRETALINAQNRADSIMRSKGYY